MKRCLHIMNDEKIINRAIDMFEKVYPSENKYIVIHEGISQYVAPRENIVFIQSAANLIDIIEDLNEYKYVIIHCLRVDVAKALLNVKNENICWIEWGADLYQNLLEYKGFQMYEQDELKQLFVNSKYPYLIALLKRRLGMYYRQHIVSKFVKRVKYFMPDSTPDELPLLQKYYPQFSHLKYKEIFYYPVDEILGEELIDKTCEGCNIMVNHSASLTGNHVGIFKKLATLNLGKRKVVTPISYGQQKYRTYIRNKGNEILKDSFEPIETFMPLNEYNKLLLSANVFIYGHWRQEAVGNILVAFFIGGKVFLSSRNPLYNYYKRIGLIFFSLEELNDKIIKEKLDQNSIENNRTIIKEHYSRERLCSLIREDFA